MNRLLAINPLERISAKEALKHAYFDDLTPEEILIWIDYGIAAHFDRYLIYIKIIIIDQSMKADEPGFIIIKLKDANLTRDTEILGKMDPFCLITFGEVRL